MFVLYEKQSGGEMCWLAEETTDRRARLLAILLSKKNASTIAVVENYPNGETSHRHTYENGEWLPNLPPE